METQASVTITNEKRPKSHFLPTQARKRKTGNGINNQRTDPAESDLGAAPDAAPPPPASSRTAPGFWAAAPRSCPKLCVSAKQHCCTLRGGGTCSPPHAPLPPLGGMCARSREGGVRVLDRVAGAPRACRRAGVCCAVRVCKGMCMHGVAAQAWRVQLGAYAEPAGRLQCPWQRPRPRRWKPEASRAALHLQDRGTSRKASMPGQRGAPPIPSFSASRPHLGAQCAEWKGATGKGLISAEEPLGLTGAAPWPTGSVATHTEAASRLHREPTQRGRNESHTGLAQPVP